MTRIAVSFALAAATATLGFPYNALAEDHQPRFSNCSAESCQPKEFPEVEIHLTTSSEDSPRPPYYNEPIDEAPTEMKSK